MTSMPFFWCIIAFATDLRDWSSVCLLDFEQVNTGCENLFVNLNIYNGSFPERANGLNPFMVNFSSLYYLKTSKSLWFSNLFRGHKKAKLTGLKRFKLINDFSKKFHYRYFRRTCALVLQKSLMENFIFCAVIWKFNPIQDGHFGAAHECRLPKSPST